MGNPWKYATIGLLAVALTAATASLMTAYVMRPAGPEAQAPASAPAAANVAIPAPKPVTLGLRDAALAPTPRRVAAHRTVAIARATPEEMPPAAAASASPVTAPAATPAPAAPPAPESSTQATPSTPSPVVLAPSTTPTVDSARASTTTASAPADCASGGDRALRIAKPGGIGGLVGAALGAVSGAIANGGNGAGKGALIGAGVGAVAGSAYGAYKTKQDCGTIFGTSNGVADAHAPNASSPPSGSPARSETPQAAFQTPGVRVTSAPDANRITVYDVR